jgi:HEAT repeat protein
MVSPDCAPVTRAIVLTLAFGLLLVTGGCRPSNALDATIARAKTGFVANRVFACKRLAQFSTEPERGLAVRTLLELLGDRDPLIRQAATRSLAEMNYVQATQRIIPLLRDHSTGVAMDAIDSLAQMRADDAYPAIVEALHTDKRISVRAVAAKAVGTYRRPDALKVLSEAFRSETSEVVRRAIVEAAATIGTPSATRFLEDASRSPGLGGDAARSLLQGE